MKLTAAAIKDLAPADGRKNYIVFDDDLSGFGIKVTERGIKSFVLRYRVDGRPRELTIGRWPAWTATAAREKAKGHRRAAEDGRDPLGDRQARREAPTFREVAQQYLREHAAKKKSGDVDRGMLERDIFPVWGPRKAEDISRKDVREVLRAKAETAPVMANRLLACVRKLYNWAIVEEIVGANPCFRVPLPGGRETSKDRVLSADELRRFWRELEECERVSSAVKGALKLTLVTAVRPGEACRTRVVDVHDGWWTIPAGDSKNALAHRVPLSPLAQEVLLDAVKPLEGFYFATPRTGRPLQVNALSHALRREAGQFTVKDFTPHDLRRTAASHMASLGVSRFLLRAVLNHKDREVTAVYDRHSYDPEKREALERWGTWLTEEVIQRRSGKK